MGWKIVGFGLYADLYFFLLWESGEMKQTVEQISISVRVTFPWNCRLARQKMFCRICFQMMSPLLAGAACRALCSTHWSPAGAFLQQLHMKCVTGLTTEPRNKREDLKPSAVWLCCGLKYLRCPGIEREMLKVKLNDKTFSMYFMLGIVPKPARKTAEWKGNFSSQLIPKFQLHELLHSQESFKADGQKLCPFRQSIASGPLNPLRYLGIQNLVLYPKLPNNHNSYITRGGGTSANNTEAAGLHICQKLLLLSSKEIIFKQIPLPFVKPLAELGVRRW